MEKLDFERGAGGRTMGHSRLARGRSSTPSARVRVTGDFELVVRDTRVSIPHSLERVIAYLAVTDHPVPRTRIAGTLWADVSEARAIGNLRTALWRLDQIDVRLIARIDDRLRLGPDVTTDVRELGRLVDQLIAGSTDPAAFDLTELNRCEDILRDWDDDWIVGERARFRLLRLEALERAAESLIERGQLSRALEAAVAAMVAEPLRESSRRLIAEIQIRRGNLVEVLRGYEEYRVLLRDELGLDPTPAIDEIVLRATGARTLGRAT
jgi:DNA-binding SARP family transcriptional activator